MFQMVQAAICHGLVKAPAFLGQHGRRQHHGQGEAEFFRAALRHAHGDACRNGGARAGKAPEGQAQALHGADQHGLADGQGAMLARLQARRHDDQHASGGQRGGHQFRVAEQVLDFKAGRILAHDVRNRFQQAEADDARQRRGGREQQHIAAQGAGRSEIRGAPGCPEIHDDGEHGAGVQHHQQHGQFRRGGIQTHPFFRHDDVGGAGDGQQFGEALDDGKNQ